MPDSLLVVAKRPAPGQTKTRLCPPLDLGEAAALYECFLRDTLDIMRGVQGVENHIVYLPEDAGGFFRSIAPDMALSTQVGQSLGQRLDELLTRALYSGSQKAVVINSDSPSLPVEYLEQAFSALDDADVVLGPAEDGGYYLIGIKEPQPELLLDVEMSTSHVLTDTLEISREKRLSVALLPEWYDVDTVDALIRLRKELSQLSNGMCQHTIGWFQRHELAGRISDWRWGMTALDED